jgi:hypothetical protein
MVGLGILFWVGSLLPLAAMLAALFAAVWIKEGERERTAARPRSSSSTGRL